MNDIRNDIPSKIVKLPSRAQIEIRPLMMAEENIIAKIRKSSRAKVDKVMEQIIDRCTLSVIDPGPYSFMSEGGRPVWDKMLSGDMTVAMMNLSELTYENEGKYDIPEVQCTNPTCREVFECRIDSREELDFKEVTDEQFEMIKKGTPCEVEIDGRKVTFGFEIGETAKNFKRFRQQNPDREASCSIRSRIFDVEGIERRDILDWLDGTGGKYPGLTSLKSSIIRKAMNDSEIGIDLEVKVNCPECGRAIRFDLPLEVLFKPPSKD